MYALTKHSTEQFKFYMCYLSTSLSLHFPPSSTLFVLLSPALFSSVSYYVSRPHYLMNFSPSFIALPSPPRPPQSFISGHPHPLVHLPSFFVPCVNVCGTARLCVFVCARSCMSIRVWIFYACACICPCVCEDEFMSTTSRFDIHRKPWSETYVY